MSATYVSRQELQTVVVDFGRGFGDRLSLDVESAYKSLATGQEDVRARVAPHTEERKARLAAAKAAEEERKRNLETIEDNLILKGAV